MKCKHCGEEVGEFYSDLDTHMWIKHREIILKFLKKQILKDGGKEEK